MKFMIKFLTLSTFSIAIGFGITVTSLSLLAGFDGANALGGEGVHGAPGGYNYIGKGLQVGKPAATSKSTDSQPAGSKGASGGQPGGKGGKGRGDCGK